MTLDLVCRYFLLFFFCSMLGWLMEVTCKLFQFHRFINRGFLIGPYCPIYGFGAVFVTLLLSGFSDHPVAVFLLAMLVCGTLEYVTSYVMEKLFHARWWDYSQKPMNLNGRVWIGNLMLFGLASVVIVVWIDPVYFRLIEKLPLFWLHFAAIAIVTLLVSDCVVSHVMMDIVRREIDAQEGDSTEEISRRVHELLRDRNLFLRRIHQAYPELQAHPRAMMERLKQARRDFKDAQRRTKELLNEQARRRKNGEAMEELAARLEAASAAMKERRAKLRELERKLRREED